MSEEGTVSLVGSSYTSAPMEQAKGRKDLCCHAGEGRTAEDRSKRKTGEQGPQEAWKLLLLLTHTSAITTGWTSITGWTSTPGSQTYVNKRLFSSAHLLQADFGLAS